MKLPQKDFNSFDEYVEFVDSFVSLLDKQMNFIEEMLFEENNISDVIHQMPALISLINTVGYLRGQDGMFFDVRPRSYGMPNNLYSYEGHFEQRLYKIIEVILQSRHKNEYIDRLEQYFVQTRSHQNPRDLECRIDFLT